MWMSRSEYYHRQADLCVRMALAAESTKSAFDCWTQLTNIGIWPPERRLSTVTTPLNDLLRVMTDDSILDQVRI
jgi:hypothetical protein